MAQFIGQTGAHLSDQAFKRRMTVLLSLMIGFGVFCFVIGTTCGYMLGHRLTVWASIPALVAILATLLAFHIFDRRIDAHLHQARMEEEGAAGEREILPFLKTLSDTVTVVCDMDFADSYGNIDHLVLGPTGIFAIDVKNWRGTVKPDGKGELLYNDRPTDKPVVRAFVARTMNLKERLKALTGLDPYVQCIFVFPRTRVEANWGSTGAVHCIRIEQVADYIRQGNKHPIPPADLPRLIAAARALKETLGQTTHTGQTEEPTNATK